MHRVKSEEVNHQTAKRIGKNNNLRERQQQKLLDSVKNTSWINQKFYFPRLWNMSKKAMDDFEKIIAQFNQNKCAKKKIFIVHLVLEFEEDHHSW